MANYRKIIRHFPEVREYARLRKWVHRGETLSYGTNIESDVLSTDAMGFRHTVYQGQRLSVADCIAQARYGLVLGPSNVYGFGVPSNAHTIPARLGERLGIPFGNISLPEGHTRNLFAILLNIVTRAKARPSAVLLLSGGDFTGWAYTGISDPVFGPPNLHQFEQAIKDRGGKINLARETQAMLSASALWTNAIAQLCRSAAIPLIFGNDTTFFEKDPVSEYDVECELGVGQQPPQKRQFDIHRELGRRFYEQRRRFCETGGFVLAGPGPANAIGFIDEFHYDASGTDALCEEFAPALEIALTKS